MRNLLFASHAASAYVAVAWMGEIIVIPVAGQVKTRTPVCSGVSQWYDMLCLSFGFRPLYSVFIPIICLYMYKR